MDAEILKENKLTSLEAISYRSFERKKIKCFIILSRHRI